MILNLGVMALIQSGALDAQGPALIGLGLVTLMLFSIAIQLATAALIHGVFRRLRGERASFSECIQTGLSRLGTVFIYSVISNIAIGLGTMLCVIPGLVLQTMWYVGLPAVVVENLDATDGLRRSDVLTTNHRWPIFGIIFLVAVFNNVAGMVASALALPLQGTVPLVGPLVNAFLSSFIIALGAVFTAVTYHDLRVSKEGIDSDELASVFD
ncbi:MAG: hypothetical protein AAGA48_20580 [Myxococcota bacterium]